MMSELEKIKIREEIMAMTAEQQRTVLEVIPCGMMMDELKARYDYMSDFYTRITTESDAMRGCAPDSTYKRIFTGK